MRKSVVVAVFLIRMTISLFGQEGCSVPAEDQTAQPAQVLPLMMPAFFLAAAEETLWTLVLLSSRWDYDPALRLAKVSGVIFNEGDERVRGAGLQAALLDGAGRRIATAWKTGSNVYLEAKSYDTISLEISLPPGPGPATVSIETIAVTGSCGW